MLPAVVKTASAVASRNDDTDRGPPYCYEKDDVTNICSKTGGARRIIFCARSQSYIVPANINAFLDVLFFTFCDDFQSSSLSEDAFKTMVLAGRIFKNCSKSRRTAEKRRYAKGRHTVRMGASKQQSATPVVPGSSCVLTSRENAHVEAAYRVPGHTPVQYPGFVALLHRLGRVRFRRQRLSDEETVNAIVFLFAASGVVHRGVAGFRRALPTQVDSAVQNTAARVERAVAARRPPPKLVDRDVTKISLESRVNDPPKGAQTLSRELASRLERALAEAPPAKTASSSFTLQAAVHATKSEHTTESPEEKIRQVQAGSPADTLLDLNGSSPDAQQRKSRTATSSDDGVGAAWDEPSYTVRAIDQRDFVQRRAYGLFRQFWNAYERKTAANQDCSAPQSVADPDIPLLSAPVVMFLLERVRLVRVDDKTTTKPLFDFIGDVIKEAGNRTGTVNTCDCSLSPAVIDFIDLKRILGRLSDLRQRDESVLSLMENFLLPVKLDADFIAVQGSSDMAPSSSTNVL